MLEGRQSSQRLKQHIIYFCMSGTIRGDPFGWKACKDDTDSHPLLLLAAVRLCIMCARNTPRASCTNINITTVLANTRWGVHIVHANATCCKLSILFLKGQSLTEMAEHQLNSLLGLSSVFGGVILCKACGLMWSVCVCATVAAAAAATAAAAAVVVATSGLKLCCSSAKQPL